MIPNLMTWCLLFAVLVIVFVAGLAIGRLQEQDAQRARVAKRLVSVHAILREEQALLAACTSCGAMPGERCLPVRHRVPTKRSGR